MVRSVADFRRPQSERGTTMKKFALVLALLGVVACGDDEETDTLSQQEAAQAFGAFSTTFANAQTAMIDEETGSATVTCAGGGTIMVAGTVGETSINYTATYAACTEGNVTINGTLTITGDINTALTVSGSLSFSGAVNGGCSINVTVTASGMATGSVCGQDISQFGG